MNWGNKLLLTFLVFGGLMAYLVYRSLNTNFELVEKDYYKNELKYQQVIDGSKRISDLNPSSLLKQTEKNVVLEVVPIGIAVKVLDPNTDQLKIYGKILTWQSIEKSLGVNLREEIETLGYGENYNRIKHSLYKGPLV